MKAKVCIIIASSDRTVIKTALRFTWKSTKEEFFEDSKLFLFGPSEEIIAKDGELQLSLRELMDLGKEALACKWCSDDYGVSDILEKLGIKVDFIGSIVSQTISEGYAPMVW